MKTQQQQGGDRSVNLQGETVIYQAGISMSDARTIAEDVFKANALELAGIAKTVATARCEEWSSAFLRKLRQESPALLGTLVDPDIQHVLFSAQRDFARSGDSALGEDLIDLLVKRCLAEPQSLEQLVLNEAVATLPKLTRGQVATLTAIWSLTRKYDPTISSAAQLASNLARHIAPLVPDISASKANLEHLSYAGCLTLGTVLSGTIRETLMWSYGQLFCKGLSEEDLPGSLRAFWGDSRIFIPNAEDESLKRVVQRSEMPTVMTDFPEDLEFELHSVREENYLDPNELVELMSADYPAFSDLCTLWDNSSMGTAALSSVGITIAHTNWTRIYGPDEELGVWIH